MAIDRDEIRRAKTIIDGRLHRTPLLSCRTLGPRTFLKAELFQKTGSFKPRGMLNVLASLSPEEKRRGIVTWSAGNAAQGAAFAAAAEGVACTVFMWATANPLKVAATRAYGAEVDLTAASPAEAHELLLAYVEETGRTFVHPFDDPILQAGHGTLGARGPRRPAGRRDRRRPRGGWRAHRRRCVGRRLPRRRSRARRSARR